MAVFSAVRRAIPLASGYHCPACGEETMRRAYPWLLSALERLAPARLNYRSCRRCSWSGMALRSAAATPAASGGGISMQEWVRAAGTREGVAAPAVPLRQRRAG